MAHQAAPLTDCKIKVRKYVLVANPSCWPRESPRIVVQSPVLSLPKTQTLIPVRRFNGKQENLACYIPSQDIEKVSSSIYEKQQVSQETKSINAHGVAITDAPEGSGFQYKRNDRFWLLIGGNDHNDCKTIAPVANLRTMEQGRIALGDVVWYPTMRSTAGELCTLGGMKKEIQIHKQYNKQHFGWVCKQKTTDSAAFGDIMNLQDCVDLTPEESRAAFAEILRCRSRGENLLTPPVTPVRPSTALPGSQASPIVVDTPKSSRPSSRDDALADVLGQLMRAKEDATKDRNGPNKKAFEPAISLLGPVSSDPTLIMDAKRMEARLKAHGERAQDNAYDQYYRHMYSETCASKNPACPYSLLHPNPHRQPRTHFHLPASNCTLSAASSPQTLFSSSQTASTNPSAPHASHQHCISRLPYPSPNGSGSACLLASLPSTHATHTCCIWPSPLVHQAATSFANTDLARSLRSQQEEGKIAGESAVERSVRESREYGLGMVDKSALVFVADGKFDGEEMRKAIEGEKEVLGEEGWMREFVVLPGEESVVRKNFGSG